LGINGAGKSTTMRLLAGTELPNSGKITRSARISWPMGFAGGLHPAMTGRENIEFLARVYGQSPRKAVEFVEDFAEIGAYIDEPYGTYSSGMGQRLAFGLSMAIDFECYLIDEVIAVGDARFQLRCLEEFSKRRARSDIIMISHSMEHIRNYCTRGIVLAHGVMHEFSNVDEAIELYNKLNQ
jgi:capsular polysaccharide transport system ATP-binding protein